MANNQIRIGQLIAPFGPGSLYTDSRGIPHIICGLDFWHKRWRNDSLQDCDDLKDFERFEPRLSELLKVNSFRIPPDFRFSSVVHENPPNHSLHIPAHRFPTWYRHTKTGRLKRFQLDTTHQEIRRTEETDEQGKVVKGFWQPVRFVAVCSAGHLEEFPWKQWCGCSCAQGKESLFLLDQGGSDLSSIQIKCRRCSKSKTLSGTTSRPAEAGEKSAFGKHGIHCSGSRPWLGTGAEPSCDRPLVGCLINQTSIYYSRTTSAISLPHLSNENDEFFELLEIAKALPGIGPVKALWRLDLKEQAVAAVVGALPGAPNSDTVFKILESIFDQALVVQTPGAKVPADEESVLLNFRRAEFNILRNNIDDAKKSRDLRVVSTEVSQDLGKWFSKINLVERLKETRVFYGFDRLEQRSDQLAETLKQMPDPAVGQLFRRPPEPSERWLPAVEVFGEGIYFELNESEIASWQKTNASWLAARLNDQFLGRLNSVFQTLPPPKGASIEWASRYLMVHSLAHIFINQLVFECGYSTASLRERLFVSADHDAPMAAFMIYTSAGDSEGTLGGLVRLGRPDRLGPVVSRAVSRASWCSADPVCSENFGGQGSQLANLAACHGCILLPETSCETINHGLDRAMVVGTPEDRGRGFMASMIKVT